MRAAALIVTVAALAPLPLSGAAPALAATPNSAAYPSSPTGTPAAGDNGKPVTPKSDPGAQPGPAGAAGTEGAKASTGTPASAYPGAPTNQPAAGAKP